MHEIQYSCYIPEVRLRVPSDLKHTCNRRFPKKPLQNPLSLPFSFWKPWRKDRTRPGGRKSAKRTKTFGIYIRLQFLQHSCSLPSQSLVGRLSKQHRPDEAQHPEPTRRGLMEQPGAPSSAGTCSSADPRSCCISHAVPPSSELCCKIAHPAGNYN